MSDTHSGKGLIPNSAYAPQLKELENRVPSTLTDKEADELRKKSARVQQAKHKKTALTHESECSTSRRKPWTKLGR
jgi:hypothetical protein